MDKKAVMTIGVPAAIIIVAAGLYIMKLQSDLSAANQQVASATQQAQSLRSNLAETQQQAESVTAARDQLQTQLDETNTKLESVSSDLGAQVEALKAQVAALRANIAGNERVKGYWRDLFDYTKPFNNDGTEKQDS